MDIIIAVFRGKKVKKSKDSASCIYEHLLDQNLRDVTEIYVFTYTTIMTVDYPRIGNKVLKQLYYLIRYM